MDHVVIRRMQRQLDRLKAENRELRERIERHEQRTEGMSAETMRTKAREFIVNNPRAWKFALDYARFKAANQERFNMQSIMEELRYSDDVAAWEIFKSNNSLAAPLGRELLEAVPEAIPYMPLRKSKVDKFYPRLRHAVG